MFEENFDEMQWALEELENFYLLLKAYSDKKSEFSSKFSAKILNRVKSCLTIWQNSTAGSTLKIHVLY